MLTLKHNQQVKVSSFKYAQKIVVCTLKGLHAVEKYSPDLTWEEYLAREVTKPGYKLVWSYQSPAILTANYAGKEKDFQKAQDELQNAVELTDGMEVLIEDEIYKVKLLSDRYSDPIHFIKV